MTFADTPTPTYADPEGVLVALVEFFNARDFEGFQELLADDAECPHFEAHGAEAVARAFADTALHYPGILMTRGEIGEEPVTVLHTPAREPGVHGRQEGTFRRMGVFSFTFVDGEESLIEHIGYDDDPDPLENLLAEEPDPGDLPEGVDWMEWDAGEPFDAED